MEFSFSSFFSSQESRTSVDSVESVESHNINNGSFGEQSEQSQSTRPVIVQLGDPCPWCTVGQIVSKRQTRNPSVSFFACDMFNAGQGCKFRQSKPYRSRHSSIFPRKTYISAPVTSPSCMLFTNFKL